ncbi:Inner membrane ABC transporter permease protein YcjO [compost metagenome]|uniref:carbohydrate ABC transporter permease n=1 Tax=Paenibacillus TaxID=44249 RepID=UPI000FAAFAEF|nr:MULTISPECIES: sugar ABC transporter permease [Paenibacillus]MBY9077313.1 sugar ABC transporter permease [Paenibacillus sp. CGMCC 1.18879]MBY9085633.1 sugar ABC transporter permease [Paenibacillus sinensis]
MSSDSREKWWFALPGVLIIVVVLLIPIVAALGLSFFSYPLQRPDLGIRFTGLDNFSRLLSDKNFFTSLWRSVLFTLGAVAAELVLGMILALLLKGEVWGKTLFKVAFMIPMMMVPVVVGVAWRLFLLPDFTPLQTIFGFLHIPFNPSKLLTEPGWAMFSVILADVWQWTPFVMLLILANLQGISPEIYEAAQMDGASKWREFWRITLPLVFPSLLSVGILRAMDAMRTFDLVYILTSGGPGTATELLSIYNYKIAFGRYDMGYASAVSVGVMLVLGVCIFGLLAYVNRGGKRR